MSPEEVWLRDFLDRGEIQGRVDTNGWVRVTSAVLYDQYVRSLPPRSHKKNEPAFSFFLSDHLQTEKTGDREYVDTQLRDGVRSTVYLIPPLGELRARYSRRGRGATQDWDGSSEWIEIGSGHPVPARFDIVPADEEDSALLVPGGS